MTVLAVLSFVTTARAYLVKWSVIMRTFFTKGGLVQLHRGLYAGVVHQLQWGICPDLTKRSLRHFYLKCLAMRASPHYCMAILSHHGSPKSPELEPRSSAGPDDWHHNAHCLAPSSIDPQEQQRQGLPLSCLLGLCSCT